MNKEQKENINQIVNEGLGLTLEKLKISKPSSKTVRKIKKLSKKLASRLKVEVKRQGKSNSKKVSKNNGKAVKVSPQVQNAAV